MSVWGAVAGGFVGTLVLTTVLRAGTEHGLTRMDLPFLLGTALSADRVRAKAIGYASHFVAGQVFALIYFAVFSAIDRSGFALGALFGLVHGAFAGTALVNVLLPVFIREWELPRAPPTPGRCSNPLGFSCSTTAPGPRW